MPFALAGAAATVGVGLYSANKQSDAIQSGQQQSTELAHEAQAAAKDAYAPYQAAGGNALQRYGDILGLNGQDAANQAMAGFKASPGFQYQLSQGLNAVDHGAAARGMLRSGETLRAEQTLGDNLASQDFGNYLNRLSGMGTMGLQAASGLVNAYTGQATNIENTATQAAGAQAGIYGSQGNLINSGISSAANSLGRQYQDGTGLFAPNTNALMDGAGTSTPYLGNTSAGTGFGV